MNDKPKKSRIPEFKSYEEEANWWDTHDFTDYQDEFKPVKVRFAKNLGAQLAVDLDSKEFADLNKVAQKKGVGPSTLARTWIKEKLSQSHP